MDDSKLYEKMISKVSLKRLSDNIEMQFDLNKCAKVILKKGSRVKSKKSLFI